MSKYHNVCPAGYYDDEDTDEYEEYSRQPAGNSLANEFNISDFEGIKIIPKLGFQAGLNKSEFNTNLDENAQKWFDQIFKYWKQCELSLNINNNNNILMASFVFFRFRQEIAIFIEQSSGVLHQHSPPIKSVHLCFDVLRQRQ